MTERPTAPDQNPDQGPRTLRRRDFLVASAGATAVLAFARADQAAARTRSCTPTPGVWTTPLTPHQERTEVLMDVCWIGFGVGAEEADLVPGVQIHGSAIETGRAREIPYIWNAVQSGAPTQQVVTAYFDRWKRIGQAAATASEQNATPNQIDGQNVRDNWSAPSNPTGPGTPLTGTQLLIEEYGGYLFAGWGIGAQSQGADFDVIRNVARIVQRARAKSYDFMDTHLSSADPPTPKCWLRTFRCAENCGARACIESAMAGSLEIDPDSFECAWEHVKDQNIRACARLERAKGASPPRKAVACG